MSGNLLKFLPERVLLVYSDPGGAKPLLSVALYAKANGSCVEITSDRHYPFEQEFGVEVTYCSDSPAEVIARFKPDAVLTATSYTSDIEYRFLLAAQELGLSNFSFVDHWTGFRKRFTRDGVTIHPDMIFVPDKHSEEIAVAEGFDSSKVTISGNPYHDYLKRWKPRLTRQEVTSGLGLEGRLPIVVFAPDPLSNVAGRDLFGFDEISVQQCFNLLVEVCSTRADFILKAHPNQDMEALGGYDKRAQLVTDEVDTSHLIYYSDIVIGFFSNFLIEASVMNKTIYRLLPMGVKSDPLSHLDLGTRVNEEDIISKINAALNGSK